MSVCLSSNDGVKARKDYRCDLCGEGIKAGEVHDTRSGRSDDGFYRMRMHPECHRYEQNGDAVDSDWYEDISDSAFDRADAIAFCANQIPDPLAK